MNGEPPRRPPGAPPGAPPGRPPPGVAPPAGLAPNSGIKRPPGPPPGGVPVQMMKPPPRAPPPIQLNQTAQRPAVDVLKRPRSPSADESKQDMAPPKASTYVAPATKKEGAISMFEEPDEPKQIPAEIKGPPPRGPPPGRGPPPSGPPGGLPPGAGAMNRAPRPLPPRPNPPGIPDGQPLPPGGKPEEAIKAPAPVRAPPRGPSGGRAPPEEDPQSYEMRKNMKIVPPAPTSEPPLLRVKKAPVVEVVKRRERDMPEFESSDEDEEAASLVKQPLPFGVLKQPLPKTKAEREADEARARKEAAAKAAQDASDLSSMGGQSGRNRADSMVSLGSASTTQPLQAPRNNKLSGFVPPAPAAKPPLVAAQTPLATHAEADIGKHFDDSRLGKALSRGRLSIRCIEGFDIKRKDDPDKIPRNDPFIKFRLGVAERHPWKQTETQRKQDQNPKFRDELIFFDVTDPAQYVFQEDLQLCIELWNKSSTKNELIGSVTMSVVRFFKQPFVSYTEKVPIYYPGATRTPMKLSLEIVFEEARSGMMQITLFEARSLRNIDPMGQQDPFVQLALGRHYIKRSRSVKNGGTNPYFEEEDILLWLDQDNWVDNLKVSVLDEDAKEDKPIGVTEFSLLPYMKQRPEDAREDTFDLFYMMQTDPKDDTEVKEVASGEIAMRIRFMPAGSLTVYIERAKDLAFPETHKPLPGEVVRMDPYASLTIEGKAVKMIKRTPADKDGGADPVWQSEIKFDIVDQYLIDLEIFNQSSVGKDVPLGAAQVSLLNVFRSGSMENWISLKQKKANGGIKEIGDVFIRLGFSGPVAIAYPQFRPEIDSFDDTLRKMPAAVVTGSDSEHDEEAPTKEAISTIPDDMPVEEAQRLAIAQQERAEQEKLPPEFTDDEITAAFKFIDLDHNNFVGAAEIRHILVCMGEMITDEEIDMMISMVDLDGDGQVSMKEFRALVLHPNPGVVDMHREINKDKDIEVMKEKQALAGKMQGLDLTTFQRQKEITVREQKKKMIVSFVVDNEVDFAYIKRAHVKFLELQPTKRIGGRIRFPDFCAVMDVEPIQEYKNLHAFYDTEETGDMDIREFLLSMMNFVDVDKEVRIRFSFEMFDELKTGFIAQAEVEEILKGNHMLSAASVRRKADTIMKQANANAKGAITINEFVVVSKKFPNILLPAVGYVPQFKSTAVVA